MSDFYKAIPVTLRFEGGWVDDPRDAGGQTNFGISKLIIIREKITVEELGLSDDGVWGPAGRPVAGPGMSFDADGHDEYYLNWIPGCMKAMTVDTATALYKRLFWDRYQYGKINDQIAATKVMDVAVNCGPGRAHKMAQEAAGLPAAQRDGILGPASFAAINATPDFTVKMAAVQDRYYKAIVAAKPNQVCFLKNWLRRASWVG